MSPRGEKIHEEETQQDVSLTFLLWAVPCAFSRAMSRGGIWSCGSGCWKTSRDRVHLDIRFLCECSRSLYLSWAESCLLNKEIQSCTRVIDKAWPASFYSCCKMCRPVVFSVMSLLWVGVFRKKKTIILEQLQLCRVFRMGLFCKYSVQSCVGSCSFWSPRAQCGLPLSSSKFAMPPPHP